MVSGLWVMVMKRVGARRRASGMTARLQRHIGGGARRIARHGTQRQHLGMRFAGPHMPAFADRPAVANDFATAGPLRCSCTEETSASRLAFGSRLS